MSQTEEQLYDDKAKGEHVARLLEDPIIAGAFESLQAKYLQEWVATKANESEAREQLHRAYLIVGEVRTHFTQVVGNGAIAAAQIEKLKKRL